MEQYQSSISPLSGVDLRNFYSPASSRYGVPLLQQLRPQQISLGGSMNGTHAGITNNPTQIRVGPQESENKMMNQLQELENPLPRPASAISEGKLDVFSEISARLAQSANLKVNSEQRLMEYMALALKSKANSGENPPPIAELFTKEHDSATQPLYNLSMCFKLGLMAANQAPF